MSEATSPAGTDASDALFDWIETLEPVEALGAAIGLLDSILEAALLQKQLPGPETLLIPGMAAAFAGSAAERVRSTSSLDPALAKAAGSQARERFALVLLETVVRPT